MSPPVPQEAPQLWGDKPPHTRDADDCIKTLNSNVDSGLSEQQVSELEASFGPNRLKAPPKPSFFKILIRNILNAMTFVLIAAFAVSFGTKDWVSGGVIMALVILNVGVGAVQEWKSEKTVAALESVGSPVATVFRKTSTGRDSHILTIKTDRVVPGDIIDIKIGDIVPADARVIPGHISSLECDEALLTGESLPVSKTVEPIDDPICPVGDRTCMVYSGSQVTKGRARCVVTATAMQTELGKIAEAMQRKETRKETGWAYRWYRAKVILGVAETTPLQIKLNTLAYLLLGVACILAVVVVATTSFKNVPMSIATYAVATAVSLLPASLIAVVALSLANASRELAKRNALVRRMDAIETLAAVRSVCSDKTGTITLGKMVLKKAWVPTQEPVNTQVEPSKDLLPIETSKGSRYKVETGSDPFYPRGAVVPFDPEADSDETDFDEASAVHVDMLEPRFRHLVLCASLCNTASIQKSEEEGVWQGNGDATEVALTTFVHKLGHGRPHLTHNSHLGASLTESRSGDGHLSVAGSPLQPVHSAVSAGKKTRGAALNGHYQLIVEHPFDSTIKRMSVAYKFIPDDDTEKEQIVVFMKGAVERIMERCSYVGMDCKTQLEESHQNNVMQHVEALAAEGLRVLSLCGRFVEGSASDEILTMPRDELERGFGLLGLVGIYDPPRPESAAAVADCLRASVIPRMLTGDHKATATAIAIQVGIIDETYPPHAVMTGPQFDKMSEDEIDALPELPLVIARCAPETKVRMVEALHRRKALTVMTGDGVNDSPALKRSDVGVAMGKNGSDVAKQSAEIVLADDNFATIVRAIRKGRSVFSNLSKFLLYLLSGNLAEVLILTIGLCFRDETDESTFPISPVAALLINTIAAGPPALALGYEPTDKNAMDNAPSHYDTIFTFWWYMDLIFYGLVMAGLGLANFAITVYAYHDGDLGVDCNSDYNHSCQNVFQGRAACFASFLLVLMVHGLVCKSQTLSIFQMNLLDNKLLLACVTACSLFVFPIVYIPTINRDVFLLGSLTWEWGMIAASCLVFLVFAELWKVMRRIIARRSAQRTSVDEEKGARRYGRIRRRKQTLRMADTIQPEKY